MPSAGLIEMPPVSKVMPLPTSPSTGPGWRAGADVAQHEHARAARRCPGRRRAAAPSGAGAISSSSRTSTCRPASRPMRAPRSAKTDGVSTFDGSLHSSRARLQDSPRTRPRSTAASSAASCVSPVTISGLFERRHAPLGRSCRRSPLKLASIRPSAIACTAAAGSPPPAVQERHPLHATRSARRVLPRYRDLAERSVSKSTALPAPTRATRRAFQPVVLRHEQISNARPLKLSALRRFADGAAAGLVEASHGTPARDSPSKAGTNSRSVSTSRRTCPSSEPQQRGGAVLGIQRL